MATLHCRQGSPTNVKRRETKSVRATGQGRVATVAALERFPDGGVICLGVSDRGSLSSAGLGAHDTPPCAPWPDAR